MTHAVRLECSRFPLLCTAVLLAAGVGCQQRLVEVPANDPNPPVVVWQIENLTTGKVSREAGAFNYALGDVQDTLRVTVTASNPGGVRDLGVVGWGQPLCANADNLENPNPARTDLKPVNRGGGDLPKGRGEASYSAVYQLSVLRGAAPEGQRGTPLVCPEGFLRKKGETYGLTCTATNFSGKQTVSKIQIDFKH